MYCIIRYLTFLIMNIDLRRAIFKHDGHTKIFFIYFAANNPSKIPGDFISEVETSLILEVTSHMSKFEDIAYYLLSCTLLSQAKRTSAIFSFREINF